MTWEAEKLDGVAARRFPGYPDHCLAVIRSIPMGCRELAESEAVGRRPRLKRYQNLWNL